MENLAKADWTDPGRAEGFIQTYSSRYGTDFWQAMSELVGTGQRPVIADFGCGPGIWLADAASRFKAEQVFALDASEVMLDFAHETLSKAKSADDVSTYLVDFDHEAIPLDPESLDLAFSGYFMHEVADPAAFIQQVAALLKPAGVCVVYDFISGDEGAFIEQMVQRGMPEERARKRYPHMCKHSLADLKRLLEQAELADIRSTTLQNTRAVVVGIKRLQA
jgi:ubiquinone/menaquinone biosynthesis C-methylase UbiE